MSPHSEPRPTATRPRVCFVSYRLLSRLALSIVEEFSDRADIEVVDELFESALTQARHRERQGVVDVFVSAGANAMILRGSIKTPVATITSTGYDILIALLKARELSSRVGVVTYRETIPELDAVRTLLNIEVSQRSYHTPEEAAERFRELAALGHRVIVGSSIVVELAEQQGLCGILVYSLSSIRRGIEDAIELARVTSVETARTERLNSVLDNLQEAVLAVDENHRLIAINPGMEQLLNRSRHTLIGLDLSEVEPQFSLLPTLETGDEERGGVTEYARRAWVVHRTPIREKGRVRGAVLTLYAASDIAEADTNLRSVARGRQSLRSKYSFRDLHGESIAFLRAKDAALRFARTDLTVLISGESGTGKELFAQAIHSASPRADRPFVAVNCSAFPETLLESELFGYEDGAFTGARRGGKSGLFEAAHTGTLFLDEIGDMPLPLQTRMLRVLQEREVVRIGGIAPIPIDVRIIAASHQPLPELVDQKAFRADLYFRLNILRLGLPALRQRPEDILQLSRELFAKCMRRLGGTVQPNAVLKLIEPQLTQYHWPGNVRELENLCERLAVFFSQFRSLSDVRLDHLSHDCPELFGLPVVETPVLQLHERLDPDEVLEALHKANGNRKVAAQILGISRATLWRRMRALGIGNTDDSVEVTK